MERCFDLTEVHTNQKNMQTCCGVDILPLLSQGGIEEIVMEDGGEGGEAVLEG